MAGNRHSRYSLKSSLVSENRFFQFTARPKRPYNHLRTFYGESMERLGSEAYSVEECDRGDCPTTETYEESASIIHDHSNNGHWAFVYSLLLTIILVSTLVYLLN